MAVSVLSPAIPASQLVNVVPSVLSGGDNPLQFNGLIIDANLSPSGLPVLPHGTVYSFASAGDVSSYFGATSQEAGLGSVYFSGPNNATIQPSALFLAQYALFELPAFLRGGNISSTALSTLQAISAGSLSVTINGTLVTTSSLNLSTATSFSNAAQLINTALANTGIAQGQVTATLSATSPQLNVTALVEGPEQATGTANLSGTTMTVTAATNGYFAVGQVVTGTGITAGTTIVSYNSAGQPGGAGSYTLSASATTGTAIAVTAYAPAPVLTIGQIVTGTGISGTTYISGYGTGTGGVGTYVLSQNPTAETSETISVFAPGVTWEAAHGAFVIHSSTVGTGSTITDATGSAAATLGLTQGAGAVLSQGCAADTPATFMASVIAQTLDWVEFMTTWEPTDADKIAFATWNNSQGDRFVYSAWETDILDTEASAGSALANELISGALDGTNLIWTNPTITTLAGEKAAFQLSWTACLDFTRRNGRQTAAFKGYAGGLPDVTNATIAQYLAGSGSSFGYGANFYGKYSTANQSFNLWQRGLISGKYVWKDSYVNQIWLNNALQLAILEGLQNSNSVPYTAAGNVLVESWCLDPITQAVNFGAIVAGVALSNAQAVEVNTAAGLAIDQVLTNRGWYLQILASTAPSTTRATRSSPSCTLWYCDGGSVQSITLASIEIQ